MKSFVYFVCVRTMYMRRVPRQLFKVNLRTFERKTPMVSNLSKVSHVMSIKIEKVKLLVLLSA